MKKIIFSSLLFLFFVIIYPDVSVADSKSNFFMPSNAMSNTAISSSQINNSLRNQLYRLKYREQQKHVQQKKITSAKTAGQKKSIQKTVDAKPLQITSHQTDTRAKNNNSVTAVKHTATLNKQPTTVLKTQNNANKDTANAKIETAEKNNKTLNTAIATAENKTAATTKENSILRTNAEANNSSPDISLQNPFEIALQSYQEDLTLIQQNRKLNNPRLNAMLEDYVDKEHVIRVQ